MRLIDLGFTIILHILISLVSVSAIYFALISPEEKKAVQSNLLDKIEEKVSQSITDEQAMQLAPFKSQIQHEEARSEGVSDNTLTNNSYLRIIIAVVVSSLILLVIVPLFYLCVGAKYRVPIGWILIENILLIVLIAVFEVFFFKNYAFKYSPILPSQWLGSIKDATAEV